jgi:hypothetical protein
LPPSTGPTAGATAQAPPRHEAPTQVDRPRLARQKTRHFPCPRAVRLAAVPRARRRRKPGMEVADPRHKQSPLPVVLYTAIEDGAEGVPAPSSTSPLPAYRRGRGASTISRPRKLIIPRVLPFWVREKQASGLCPYGRNETASVPGKHNGVGEGKTHNKKIKSLITTPQKTMIANNQYQRHLFVILRRK